MSIESIPPSEHADKTRARYAYLLDDNREIPEANLPPDQLRAFLDGLNDYLAELDKLDLPPEYLSGINQVLDEQVSLVVGEKVSPIPTEKKSHVPEDGIAPVVCGHKVPEHHDESSHGDVPVVGKVGNAPAAMPQDLWELCVAAGQKTGVDPYILAAQMEKESRFGQALNGSPSAGDGLMQVESSTRAAYAGKFLAKMGHAYNHASKADQVAMAAVIISDKGGTVTNMLQKYNGGDNWKPGTCDSYGREIKAAEYASTVIARAKAMQ